MTQSTDLQTAIATINHIYKEIIKNGDETDKAALYKQEKKAVPPNGDFVTDQETLKRFWQSAMDMGIKETQEVIEAEGHGDPAIEISMDKPSSTTT